MNGGVKLDVIAVAAGDEHAYRVWEKGGKSGPVYAQNGAVYV